MGQRRSERTAKQAEAAFRLYKGSSFAVKWPFLPLGEVHLKVKDIELKKREAELYALQSQIHPHFLFNTNVEHFYKNYKKITGINPANYKKQSG